VELGEGQGGGERGKTKQRITTKQGGRVAHEALAKERFNGRNDGEREGPESFKGAAVEKHVKENPWPSVGGVGKCAGKHAGTATKLCPSKTKGNSF